MGKVGSTSLEESIPESIHVHSFFNHPVFPIFLNAVRNRFINRLKRRRHLTMMSFLIKRRRKIKIISVIRDSYSRNISAFFQHLDSWVFSATTGCPNPKRYKSVYHNRGHGIELIHDIFNRNFNHEYGLEWFDKEFKRFTGIDVYKYPFDKEKGYGMIQVGRFECLLLTVEQMNKNLALIEDFVGKKIDLKNVNVGDKKWYAPVYKEFKRTYKPSLDYIEKIYTSPLMQHFYTKEQIEIFKKNILCNADNY